MKKFVCVFITVLLSIQIYSQEALKSIEEEYFDFLSLQGLIDRPTLGYRTLSDSVWNIDENVQHIWQNNNLGKTHILFESENQGQNWFSKEFFHGLKLKIFGPEWFNSYNTAAPYGQNDGALWQGRGYNTSFTTGIRLEGYGFEATFKPQFCFSQNLEFDYVTPNYENEEDLYKNKAGLYGYYGVRFIDAPQRFGDKSFFTFDWGDSEIRYSWKTLTIGFGTQSIWLGPAQINPIIHSNNAPTYPKIDVGLRKTEINIPWWDLYLGDLEFRCWAGKLSESDYFDIDESNNNNLISAFSINWALPWIFEGLTIGINRTMLSKWNKISPYTLFGIYIPWMSYIAGEDESDQRASITLDYLIPNAGFEIYFEWARNDFSPNINYIIRYPFHTQALSLGMKKQFELSSNLQLQILFELTHLECSQDYDRLIAWYSSFYSHHKITQGYTNKGQWLGAGIGTGGNSQYLGIRLLYQKGFIEFFIQRRNPDLDYTMYIDSRKNPPNTGFAERSIRAILDMRLQLMYFSKTNFNYNIGIIFEDEHNPLNYNENPTISKHRYNISIQVGLKYNF